MTRADAPTSKTGRATFAAMAEESEQELRRKLAAKLRVANALSASRDRDPYLVAGIETPHAYYVYLGVTTEQIVELKERAFVVQSDVVSEDWGGFICIAHADDPTIDDFRLLRGDIVTILAAIDDTGAQSLIAGKAASLEAGHYDGRPVTLFLIAQPTPNELESTLISLGVPQNFIERGRINVKARSATN